MKLKIDGKVTVNLKPGKETSNDKPKNAKTTIGMVCSIMMICIGIILYAIFFRNETFISFGWWFSVFLVIGGGLIFTWARSFDYRVIFLIVFIPFGVFCIFNDDPMLGSKIAGLVLIVVGFFSYYMFKYYYS